MRLITNVCRFLCFVIAFGAFAQDSVFNQTCGPETQPREPYVQELSEATAVRKVIRHRTVTAPETLDQSATHVTIVIPLASVEAMLAALQQGQRQGDLVAVTLPILPARDTFIGLHIALLPERVTRMTLRE